MKKRIPLWTVLMFGGLGALAAPAQSSIVYHNGSVGPNSTVAGPSIYNLRASIGASDDGVVYVAAHLPGGWTLYGSWVSAWWSACHSYAAGNTLGGIMHNPHSFSAWMVGGADDQAPC